MRLSLIPFALLAAAVMSCSSNTAIAPASVPYGNFIGRMTGRVLPLDVNYDSMTSLYAGTTISLKGTAMRGTTDANGNWTIDSVPAGIYTILYSKPGFDTGGKRKHSFSGAGVDFVPDGYVVRVPTDTLVLDYVRCADTTDPMFRNSLTPIIYYGGHYLSTMQLSVPIHIAIVDSTFRFPVVAGGGSTGPGVFTGYIYGVDDPVSGAPIPLVRGQTIKITAELLPRAGFSVPGYISDVHGTPVPDLSNTLTVTIP